jgi:DNA-binding NarL/FixJ family response regulator
MNNDVNPQLIKVLLADDHVLLRSALTKLINDFDSCKVIAEAGTGKELVALISNGLVPDIVLMDLNMPDMDGYETSLWLKNNYPAVHVLMLTMYDSEPVLIRLLQAGVKGFLKKDIHPEELKFALQSVMKSGFYYSHTTTDKLAGLFRKQNDSTTLLEKALLTDPEIKFLRLASTDMTYKEIAEEMALNPRSVDNMRDNLFEKLSVKSRVGLALYAIRHGIITF